MRTLTYLIVLGGLFVNACSSDAPTNNPDSNMASTQDTVADTAPGDMSVIDATLDTAPAPTPDVPITDTSPPDAAGKIDIEVDTAEPLDTLDDTGQPGETAWGTITGDCGSVSAVVAESSPSILTTTFTFDDPASFDSASLEGRAKKRFDEPNAGGSSKCTEVMSMQLLTECEGATVSKLETDITYDIPGKIADYIVNIGGVKTGVSVTRAYKGPVIDVYTLEDATSLLEKKLAGISEAQQNVSADDAWEKSLIHVWTLHPEWAETVTQAWTALEADIKASTVVLITIEEGSDYIVTDACDD